MKGEKIKCPICKNEACWDDNPFRPFCSERCRLMDLGKWATGEYRIGGEKKDVPEENAGEKNDTKR